MIVRRNQSNDAGRKLHSKRASGSNYTRNEQVAQTTLETSKWLKLHSKRASVPNYSSAEFRELTNDIKTNSVKVQTILKKQEEYQQVKDELRSETGATSI